MFSIVIPTFQRRNVLLATLESVFRADMPWPCELIVAVDGSTDGTAEAVRKLDAPIPTLVAEQVNRGAASARNLGARRASGEYLLFLDDDMCVEPAILTEHHRLLTGGAAAVVGNILVHPDSPRNLLSLGIARWAERRHTRLTGPDGAVSVQDFLTGQLSVEAGLFREIGGFDDRLTAGGRFGGEDTDFLFRLTETGAEVRYGAAAVSYQRYVVTPKQNLLQWRDAGVADERLSRKHPALRPVLWRQHHGDRGRGRLARALAPLHPATLRPVRSLVERRVAAGRTDQLTDISYSMLRDISYWAGRQEAGEDQGGRVHVLAYHAVDDHSDDPYTVRTASFRNQITALRDCGFDFLDASTLLDVIAGRARVGRPSVLVTFDDGYVSVADNAAPVLQEHDIPAVVFAVTGQIGGTNVWDSQHGAAGRPLLDAERLASLSKAGWAIGSHTRSHRHLRLLPRHELADELRGPLADLADAGLPRARLLAYPFGEHDVRVRGAAAAAGYAAAFALGGGRIATGDRRRLMLPRLEIGAPVTAGRLVRQLQGSSRASTPGQARREVGGVLRLVGETVTARGSK